MERPLSLPPIIDRYLEWLSSAGRSPRTVSGYRLDLGVYLGYLGGMRQRDSLEATRADIEGYAVWLNRRGLSARTRARMLAAVRGFYQWAATSGILPTDPSASVRPPRVARGLPRFLTADEVHALLFACPTDSARGVRNRAILELGLSGLRVSEVVSLDLDSATHLERSQIAVRRKGGDFRTVELADRTVHAVRAWLEIRPPCPSPALFIPVPPRRPYRLSSRWVQVMFSRLARRAGIQRRVGFHSLRHTLGTALADAGVPLQEIQEILGHASPVTTRVYVQVARARVRAALRDGLRVLGLDR